MKKWQMFVLCVIAIGIPLFLGGCSDGSPPPSSGGFDDEEMIGYTSAAVVTTGIILSKVFGCKFFGKTVVA